MTLQTLKSPILMQVQSLIYVWNDLKVPASPPLPALPASCAHPLCCGHDEFRPCSPSRFLPSLFTLSVGTSTIQSAASQARDVKVLTPHDASPDQLASHACLPALLTLSAVASTMQRATFQARGVAYQPARLL